MCSDVCETTFPSEWCAEWLMSQIPAESEWWMLPSQSAERSHADRQDANCKSFGNVMTDWHAPRDDTSRCWRCIRERNPEEDFSAAGASETGGQRRHHTYKESSSELFKVKQKRLTDHSSWYDPEQTSCCVCELSTPDSIYFEGEFEPQDFGSLIYHFHPKWLFHNCWRRWCKVMT